MRGTILKILALILLATLCFWFCAKARGQTPPPPPKPKTALMSPKGAEQAQSLAKVAAPAVVIPPVTLFTNTFTWGPVTNQFISYGTGPYCLHSNVVILEATPSLSAPSWSNYYTGQASSYRIVSTNPVMFVRLEGAWK